MKKKDDNNTIQVSSKLKKPYTAPTLQKYGEVKDLTTGGSGNLTEHQQVPDQAQPNRRS